MSPQNDLQTLDRIFPQDPNFSGIAYQAHENVPILIPWTRKVIVLGTGFESSVASDPNDFALRPTALEKTTYRVEPTESTSSFRQNSSTKVASSYEHMDFKGSLSAGGSVLGVSAQAAFAKNVYGNRDSKKVSLQASLRIGRIIPNTSYHLSTDALALLRASPTEFHRTYGDYFLGGFVLGADTATFLSTSSSRDLKAEMKQIQVQAKFFGMKKTVYDKRTSSQSDSSNYDITFNGFDSLDGVGYNAKAADERSYMEIQEKATKNVSGGINLDKRVKDILKGLGLGTAMEDVVQVTEEQCRAVCKSGLVVELMFLPYAGLKDYIASTFEY
ncbi:hypothetical protein VKT23_019483 [Stygiomarasmius scandens]|uniref:MACPF domain-containing protein n=1 Tax=Marasmiellus scandens TaxID=2682957 RepID=A0ABR1ILA1_9AGAR